MFMENKNIYSAPEARIFRVMLEGHACQSVSNNPIDPYTGHSLGSDTLD